MHWECSGRKLSWTMRNTSIWTSVDGENNVYGYNYGEAGLTGTRLGELQSFTAPLGDLRIPEPGTGILSLCGVFLAVSRRRRILR